MARGFGATLGAGTTDSVQSGYTAGLSTTISVSIWILRNGAGGGSLGRVWSQNAGGGTNLELFWNNGAGFYQFNVPFVTLAAGFSFPTVTTGVWHHIGITYDATNVANLPVAYVDGVQQTVTAGTVPIGLVTTLSGNWFVGNTSAGTRNWDGDLAEFAIWSGQILTANEMLSLSQGTLPFNIRNSSLSLYLPLNGVVATEPDWALAHATQTLIGTKFQPHPHVRTLRALQRGT